MLLAGRTNSVCDGLTMEKPFLTLFVSRFLVSLLVILSIFGVFTYQRVQVSREMARTTAAESLVHVEIIINDLIGKTNILEGFVHAFGDEAMHAIEIAPLGTDNIIASYYHNGKPHLFTAEFYRFAQMLHDSPAIRALELAPKGIAKYVYPIESNEAVIGYNVFEHDNSRSSAAFSRKSGLTIVDGPIELHQSGMALVARNPVYYDNNSFWGFATIVMDLPEIFESFGLNNLTGQGYEFEMRFFTDIGPQTVISTLKHQKITDAISVDRMIAGRQAIIYVVPCDGWVSAADAPYEVIFFFLLSILIAYLLTRNRVAALELLNSLEKEKHLRMVTVQAYKEVEQANTAKSDFLSAMSHDLRTPMNAIVGLCTLLRRDSGNQKKVLDYVQKLNASSQHLLGLINDILDMSKIESGKVSLNVHEFSIASLIEGVNTIVRPQARARHQAFEIKINNIEHEFLIADDLRLNQILLNLLSNAIKYTQVGGQIRLTVTEEDKHSPNIASFVFEIADNGMGMSKKFLQHVFEPFSRAESVEGSEIQGTGLGMTITHNLVQLMGGTIDIDSTEGMGTTVTVRLTLKIKHEEIKDSEYLKSKNISRILLIDDEFSVCQSVTTTMSEAGVQTVHALNGDAAMQILEDSVQGESDTELAAKKIDIILLDLKLNDENGLDVARRIKASKFKAIPIFILTSYDYTEVEVSAIEIGVKGFLMKPLFISNLKQAIELASKHEAAEDSHDDESILKGMHVLAAEDNELNSEILVDLLSIRGATCKVCCDGREVLEEFKNAPLDEYDFILMDVQMPHMNGLEATRRIRALDKANAKTIPIIAMTANAFSDDVKASINVGMNYHISKPLDMSILENCICLLKEEQEREARENCGCKKAKTNTASPQLQSLELPAEDREALEAKSKEQDAHAHAATDSASTKKHGD